MNLQPSFFCQIRSNLRAVSDFAKWWDPENFNWNFSGCLARYCSNCFEIWWDPERYNWQSCAALAHYCPQHFSVWWDPDKYKWNSRTTRLLIKYYSAFFDIWWRPSSFPWETHTQYLIMEFSHLFETWWDEKKCPWGKTFTNLPVEQMLIEKCSDYFPIWYNSPHFKLTDKLCNSLKANCMRYKDMWAQDYLIYRLSK